VALTGEEIRQNLGAFVARWSGYSGTERAEAQTFLNELLACYGTNRSGGRTIRGADQSSTLEDRFRYTPTSAFDTYPWPQPSKECFAQVAEISQRLGDTRRAICTERQIGLTRLYNEVDDGAYRPLYDLHRALDEAVATAYDWPTGGAHDPQESNRRLLELNRAIAAGEVDYRPFERL
jgi:hypothetical protein